MFFQQIALFFLQTLSVKRTESVVESTNLSIIFCILLLFVVRYSWNQFKPKVIGQQKFQRLSSEYIEYKSPLLLVFDELWWKQLKFQLFDYFRLESASRTLCQEQQKTENIIEIFVHSTPFGLSTNIFCKKKKAICQKK